MEGVAANVNAIGKDGQALWIPENGIDARSIPYLQNGTIKLDVYVIEDTNVTYGLQPAVGTNPNANTLALITIDGKAITAGDGSIALVDGWNTIEVKLTLTVGVSYNTAATAVKKLQEPGILKETTNTARNRVFAYEVYLQILRQGT